MFDPFFIFSSGRSGSTLLASMLNMHPAIHVPVELLGLYSSLPRDLRYFGDLRSDRNVDNLCRNLQFIGQLNEFGIRLDSSALAASLRRTDRKLRDVIECFYSTLLAASGKARLGDKTPNNSPYIDTVVELFPKAKIIHLIRDGRDVALSSIHAREGINNRNVYELGTLWPRNNLAVAEFGRAAPHQYLRVRYEQLIADPETELRKVCGFLEQDYCADLLRYESGDFARSNAKVLAHHSNLAKAIQRGNAGKWTVEMPPDEVKVYERRAAAALKEFGYPFRRDFAGFRWRWLATVLALQTHTRRLLRFMRQIPVRVRFVASVLLRRLLGSHVLAMLIMFDDPAQLALL